MANCYYTYEDEDKGWTVECEFTARVVPYRHGTYFDPPEGGYVEDENFEVLSFTIKIGEADHEIPLTDSLKKSLQAEIQSAYDGDDKMKDRLYDKLNDDSY